VGLLALTSTSRKGNLRAAMVPKRTALYAALVGASLVAAVVYHSRPHAPALPPRHVIEYRKFIPPSSWTGQKECDVISPNQWDGQLTPIAGDQIWQFYPPGSAQSAAPTDTARCLMRNGIPIDGMLFVEPVAGP
jgi:hypothetical protein